ncbi:MAG: peptide chain release factor N(5)-glutamine methyltransferase [Muribaculum sp.]|nr:peptide chain release factor N(5)-glutamine methyltransferase [Muribaculum sp.]
MIYRECYEWGSAVLEAAGVPDARLDACLLLETVCRTSRSDLFAHGDREVAQQECGRYEELVGRRAQRIPLQHLTGVQEFMGLEFAVNERVLIPRQDTEILVEEVLKNLHDGMRILDMCTGSGCILISLLKYSNDCSGVGVDCSVEALRTAEANADAILGADRRDAVFVQSDLFAQITGKYEFIVSNPPYIERDKIGELMPEVRDHEPVAALDGGADGLDFYRKITAQSGAYLANGGMLFFEIGCGQGADVQECMRRNGFAQIRVVKDYSGLDRVVYGTWIAGEVDYV